MSEQMFRSGMVSFHPALEPLMMPIDSVSQHPENYNCGDTTEITNSIMTNGMYRPIYVHETSREIIAGNHTWMACKELGAEQIPVILVTGDMDNARRIMVGDNEIARLARPDNGQLLGLLEVINANTGSLLGTGITDYQLEALRKLAEIPVEHDEFGQWPTLSFQVPPATKRAFMEMTEVAGGDRERFELMMRMAGWGGKE